MKSVNSDHRSADRPADRSADRPVDRPDLGRSLGLFDTVPAVGAGLPLWLPGGAVIRAQLEALALEQAAASGCQRVYTPVLAKRELFERSGHWDKFSADMFPEMIVGGESFVLRPANCPHHTQVFASRGRSYRELPLRLSELGTMFRSELSGVLGGLTRVRQINLDDAHSFCTPEQAQGEVELALRAIAHCYDLLGIPILSYRLSLRGEGGSYLGDDAQWRVAEAQLRAALEALGVSYREAPGEAAFYGPKIDVQVADERGREETLSTVQIDYNQPERFDLSYIGEDGGKHRPVMIHRGLLSSMERMTALLIDRYSGRMPTWLAPVQVRVLPVNAARHGGAALAVRERMAAAGLRSEAALRGSLGQRIRESREQRDTYLAIVGDAEMAADTVSVVAPGAGGGEAKEQLAVDEFITRVVVEVCDRCRQPRAVGR